MNSKSSLAARLWQSLCGKHGHGLGYRYFAYVATVRATMARKYKTIVIDPPWPGPNGVPCFESRRGQKRTDVRILPYRSMTGVQIASLEVPDLAADDAQLFLWSTSRNLGDAFLLAQCWSFNYRGLFVWSKPLGTGRHVRHDTEFLLWAARQGAPLVPPKQVPRQTQTWPKPRRHSAKPDEAYRLIAALSERPRIDIFARQHRRGFQPWGDEVPAKAA